MNNFIRRGLVTAAATGTLLAVGTGTALADDCVNLSRNTSATQAGHGGTTMETPFGDVTVKGKWVYIPDDGGIWLFITPGTESLLGGAVDTTGIPGVQGNFTNGMGDGLLERSGTASDGSRCAVMANGHGVAGECGEEEHAE